jgi:putative flippase GtrA
VPIKRRIRAGLRPRRVLESAWELEAIRFGVIGAANTVAGYALFLVVLFTLGRITSYLVVLVVSYGVGALVSYEAHRVWTFRSNANLPRSLARYIGVNLGVLAANAAALSFLVEVVTLEVAVAQLLSLGVVVFGSYLAHRRWSFR